ncbi:hypothetical protein K435DRAFT_773965 [Dendrothele bispora CBS 962.96]|uniref:F-box domain-containing protein n=1 Tax=Dendrothele bispora (strain CBS 962.96) TaxID=1314807 RepID=A0A4S8MQL5_DENBC|nr:hypothetical protein K435DRAFT_773965 [Dendrothele bispora CBS 962.96]
MTEEALLAVLNGLRRFPNLRSLHLRTVMLSFEVITALRNINVSVLNLQSSVECPIEQSVFENRLPLREFVYDRNMPLSMGQLSASALALFLNPTTLETFFGAQYRTENILIALASSPRPFMALKTLHIGVDVMSQEGLILAFAQCPAIEKICLHQHLWDDIDRVCDAPEETLPSYVLPNLRCYEGPPTFATFFCKYHSLKHVTLKLSHPGRSPKFDDPESICACLGNLGSFVESLDIPGGTLMTEHILSTISTSFPSMKSLSLNAYPFYAEPFSRIKQVKHALSTAVLPIGLESISLGVKVEDDFPKQDMLDHVQLCIQACPGLQIVRIRYGRYPLSKSIVWRRSTMLAEYGKTGVMRPNIQQLRVEPICMAGTPTPCSDNL